MLKGYKENIVRLNNFYHSDFYKYLEKNDPKFIKRIYNQLCLDCDTYDQSLYQELGKKFNLDVGKYCLVEQIIRNKNLFISRCNLWEKTAHEPPSAV